MQVVIMLRKKFEKHSAFLRINRMKSYHAKAMELYKEENGGREPESTEAYIDWLEATVVLDRHVLNSFFEEA